MEILLVLIIAALTGIFIRRYYIMEKGFYLERALVKRFFSNARPTAAVDENFERKAPSHMPKSVPKTMEAKMLYNKAMIFYERGDMDEAEKKFIQVISLDQNFTDAIHKLGLIYLKQDQFSRAEALFRQLVNHLDTDAVCHSNLGRALYEQEKFDEALDSYLKSIELDNSRPGRFVSTAEVYRRLNQNEKARGMYEAALQLDPTNTDYLLTYAHFLIEEKDSLKARLYVDTVLKIQPDNLMALEMKKECEQ